MSRTLVPIAWRYGEWTVYDCNIQDANATGYTVVDWKNMTILSANLEVVEDISIAKAFPSLESVKVGISTYENREWINQIYSK